MNSLHVSSQVFILMAEEENIEKCGRSQKPTLIVFLKNIGKYFH